MLTEPTTNQAADKAGVSARSIRNWLHDPDFMAALHEAETQAVAQAARQIAIASNEAVTILRATLKDPEATAAAKTSAARAILASLPPIRLLGSIEARLMTLTNELDA